MLCYNDDVIKWKHFPRIWPFVWGIHRSPVNSPHKGQCRRAVMFSLICTWINAWVNNREAGDWRRHRAHYDVIVMQFVHSGLMNENSVTWNLKLEKKNIKQNSTHHVQITKKANITKFVLILRGSFFWLQTNRSHKDYPYKNRKI